MKSALILTLLILPAWAQSGALDWLQKNRTLLDAHNCYPYEGRYADRIERALKSPFPVAIEQDIAWADGHPVVSHTSKTKGGEPALREHFFERVRPLMEKALKENKRNTWPLIVVHFDFKVNDPQVIRGVWDVLGEYEAWITTAKKGTDPRVLAPFDVRPLLVLTEDPDPQQSIFFDAVPVGAKLRIFGSAHTNPTPAGTTAEKYHFMATADPAKLLSEPPTNYRRWWNSSWYVVEEGGQRRAGEWTEADDRRLRAIVDHAHKLGYWIRFYTLDGFTAAESQGWDENYNFGSHKAVEARWKAVMEAGVNLAATDQYEAFAAFMSSTK